MPTFKLTEFRPLVRNSLRGFASGRLDFGGGIAFDIAEIAVHQHGDRMWCSWPARPLVDRDGQVMRDENGKVRYSPPLVRSADRAAAVRIEAAIIAAVRRAHPDALGDGDRADA